MLPANRALLWTVPLFLIVGPVAAQSPNIPADRPILGRAALDGAITKIDKLFLAEYQKDRAAGLTVGVVSGPQLVWTKSYGLADVERDKPSTADTVYRIGSITKQFTALMLLQLVEQGKVHLSDPVRKYFPEVKRIAGKYAAAPPITLIQLATHRGGLSQEPTNMEAYTTGPVSKWEQTLIAALKNLRYEEEPDTHFIYSNIGYAILGAALSRAAGESYTDFVREHIFVPLGMSHTEFEPDDRIGPALAKGYILHDGMADPKQPAEELKNGRGYKVPNGAVFTTVGDHARFISFEMGYGPEIVLKKKTLLDSQSQVFWAAGDATLGYGTGFMLVREANTIALGHGGSVAGFLAGAYFDPKSHLGIIFLRNAEGHGFEPQFIVSMLGMLAHPSEE